MGVSDSHSKANVFPENVFLDLNDRHFWTDASAHSHTAVREGRVHRVEWLLPLRSKIKRRACFPSFFHQKDHREVRGGRRSDALTQVDKIKQAKMIPLVAEELCFLGFFCHRSVFNFLSRAFSGLRFAPTRNYPCPGVPLSPATASPFPFLPSFLNKMA